MSRRKSLPVQKHTQFGVCAEQETVDKEAVEQPSESSDSKLWEAVAATISPLEGKSVNRASYSAMHSKYSDASIAQSSDAEPQKRFARQRGKGAIPSQSTFDAHSIQQTKHRNLPSDRQPIELGIGAPASGIDKATVRRLKRGQIPIDAKLDLHGLGRIAAEQSLRRFISAEFLSGRRCLLIITGKGGLPTAQYDKQRQFSEQLSNRFDQDIADQGYKPGILRRSFPSWMQSEALKTKVLCFCAAPRELGGSGAWLVYLRKPTAV